MIAKLAVLTATMSTLVMPVVAQYVRLETSDEQEKVGTPASKPEPQKRIADDPRKIFQRIISGSVTDRQAAAKQLAWDSAEFPQPQDARLILTNLDSDEDQEIIFVLSGSPASTVALVFDQQKWMDAGGEFRVLVALGREPSRETDRTPGDCHVRTEGYTCADAQRRNRELLKRNSRFFECTGDDSTECSAP